MAKTKTTPTKYTQDSYDRAFIKAIYELQKLGYCKNIVYLEERLDIPKRTFNQVLKGLRGVPALHRHKVQKFFVDNYDVNPRLFINNMASVFKHEPPVLQDAEVEYGSKQSKYKHVLTLGDTLEFERLRTENAAIKKENAELRKEVKYWRELAQNNLSAANGLRASTKKTATKTATAKKSKR